jgi:hypothetical protein
MSYKIRRIRWAGHVARMGLEAYRVLMGNLTEGGHLNGPNIDGRIILK